MRLPRAAGGLWVALLLLSGCSGDGYRAAPLQEGLNLTLAPSFYHIRPGASIGLRATIHPTSGAELPQYRAVWRIAGEDEPLEEVASAGNTWVHVLSFTEPGIRDLRFELWRPGGELLEVATARLIVRDW